MPVRSPPSQVSWRLPTDRTRPTRRDDVRSTPPAPHRRSTSTPSTRHVLKRCRRLDHRTTQVRHVVHEKRLCLPPPAQAPQKGPRAQDVRDLRPLRVRVLLLRREVPHAAPRQGGGAKVPRDVCFHRVSVRRGLCEPELLVRSYGEREDAGGAAACTCATSNSTNGAGRR